MPPEIDVNYADLQIEIPSEVPSFKDILLRIIDLHQSPKTYKFDETAMNSFIDYHDARNERKRSTIDNDMRGVLSKAKGQTARLAMILDLVDHCIKTATSPLDPSNSLLHVPEVGEHFRFST